MSSSSPLLGLFSLRIRAIPALRNVCIRAIPRRPNSSSRHPLARHLPSKPTAAPRSATNTPPNKNSLKGDIPIYENSDQKLYRLAYFCAGGQFVLWITVADWCWRDLRVGTDEVDEQGRKKYVLAPAWERNSLAGFCLSVGLLFLAAVQLWTSRRVRSVTLLRGGQYVGLETSNLLLRNRHVLPTSSLRTTTLAVNAVEAAQPGGYIVLKPSSHKTGFMVDRAGEFLDARLFDKLFWKKA
ncbi:transmembrane protein 223-domain-containing protein [Geranomyces variabilis]|nr:transmembrane protein 223-domain-containing protein [Geranomyces variabilis]KAJ3142710.1 hypothetical protein HDU90_002578 [Geranomyces variabilis]